METINLGAVLFGILLLLWLTYALPRTASRRDVMGRARAADEAEMTSQARDLSAAVHARRTTAEVNPAMSQDRLLLRPADPTRRPRFDAEPGTRIDPVQERARSRRLLGMVLGGLLPRGRPPVSRRAGGRVVGTGHRPAGAGATWWGCAAPRSIAAPA